MPDPRASLAARAAWLAAIAQLLIDSARGLGDLDLRTHRLALALSAALFVAACDGGGINNYQSAPLVPRAPSLPAIDSTAPHYSDALSGLYRQPATSVPVEVPVNYYAPGARSGARAVLTMALVPGANYSKLRAYHAQVGKDAIAVAPGQGGAIAEDLQIQPVLLRAVDIVKQRYPWLELMDDVATAQERNVSLTLVMDIRSKLGTKPGDPTTVEIEVIVFNDKRQPISRVETLGSATAGDGGLYGFRYAASQALDALETKSKALFN
jgi:hypothetical protein